MKSGRAPNKRIQAIPLVLSHYFMEQNIYAQETCQSGVLGKSLWRNTESITLHHPIFLYTCLSTLQEILRITEQIGMILIQYQIQNQ